VQRSSVALTNKPHKDRDTDGSLPDKANFERSVIDSKAPDISSQPEDWDGFQDPFWNLGQVLIWVATRNPKWVDDASDASGRLGKHNVSSDTYGRIAAGDQIKKHLTRQQWRDAATLVQQECVNGNLNAESQSESLSPDRWRTLEIRVIDEMPTVVSRKYPDVPGAAAHLTPDLRFRREEVLRCFPYNPTDFIEIPDVEPSQLKAGIAHQLLKQMYPENRIPAHISDETLARRASRIAQRTISRDDIRRALGTKE
jgi:hypothetical protein